MMNREKNSLKRTILSCALTCTMAFMVAASVVVVPFSQIFAADTAPVTTVVDENGIEVHSGQSFDQWLADFKREALQDGISQDLLDEAFANVHPKARIIELDRKQPEGKWTFEQYRQKIVSAARIAQGQRMMAQHHDLLEKISKQYGVAPQYIVALWGIETSYGNISGGFNVIEALATMAWEGRRADFFRKELMEALRIIQAGHVSVQDMKGSWAGAMGQNQFMPSSFKAYAADGDGDGRKDIWNNLADVFASTANYLAKSGWKDGERWGREIHVPASVTQDMIDKKVTKTLQEWKNMGVTLPDGSPIPVAPGMKASIVAPDGIGGATYFAYNNYKVIMRWNRSTYFATSVGLLADRIAFYPQP